MDRLILAAAVILVELAALLTGTDASARDGGRRIVLAEQARNYVVIVDADTQETVWTWDRSKSGLPKEHWDWFNCPTEVKPVCNGKCVLVVSNGGIGIIRIADHRMVWYAASGGGFPHSAELLPDGNVAVACSHSDTDAGDKLKIYVVDYDSFPAMEAAAVYPLPAGHNAVWDRRNKVLWATAYTTLNSYTYTVKDGVPSFTLSESIPLPDGDMDPHDMFPVYGERKLWLTTPGNLYKFSPDDGSFEKVDLPEDLTHLKSISSGPDGYPTIVLRPTEWWWSCGMPDIDGRPVYTGPSYFKIYKGRWMLDNTFSYPKRHRIKR